MDKRIIMIILYALIASSLLFYVYHDYKQEKAEFEKNIESKQIELKELQTKKELVISERLGFEVELTNKVVDDRYIVRSENGYYSVLLDEADDSIGVISYKKIPESE